MEGTGPGRCVRLLDGDGDMHHQSARQIRPKLNETLH